MEVYTLNRNEKRMLTKKFNLPDFYKEKNNPRLTFQRKGNTLQVNDNRKTLADIPGTFVTNVRYNLFTFSKYKGNNEVEK